MNVRKLSLVHFKSIKNNQFRLAPITLFTGANGVGKSSAIQAMLLAKNTSDNLHRFNRDEIELNGPYHLSLGRAEQVLSNMHESNEITIKLECDEHNLAYHYSVDELNHPYSLLLNREFSGGSPFLKEISLHYLHAERLGPRKALPFNPTSSINTGYQGEFVNHAIDRADSKNITIQNPLLYAKSALPRFSTQVEAWMNLLIPDFRLTVKPQPDVDMVTIKYSNASLGNEYIAPTATGFGITYALPIITSALLASTQNNGLLIVENPEAHLHPYSQSRMGQFLALVSMAGVQVVIETHSEHIVNGVRLQLLKRNMTDHGLVHFFTQKEGITETETIEIKNNGELSAWPKGFFDQEEADLHDILRLRRK